MLEAYHFAHTGPGGEPLDKQGADAMAPVALASLAKLDPTFASDFGLIMSNMVCGVIQQAATGEIAVTEILPTLERTLFRLTTNNEDFAASAAPRRSPSAAPRGEPALNHATSRPMSTLREMVTVDADGHVMEPADLWLRYLEPEFRDRALQIRVDADGLESLYVEGKPMRALPRHARLARRDRGRRHASKRALQTPGARSYADGCPPGGYDPRARLAVMDAEAIDMALLYPTIGICWEASVDDPRARHRLHARLQPLDRRLLQR